MKPAVLWTSSFTAALGGHAVIIGLYVFIVEPRSLPTQSVVEATFAVATHEVRRENVQAHEPETETVGETASDSSGIAAGFVPSVGAVSVVAQSVAIPPARPMSDSLSNQSNALAEVFASVIVSANPLLSAPNTAILLSESTARSELATRVDVKSDRPKATALTGARLASRTPKNVRVNLNVRDEQSLATRTNLNSSPVPLQLPHETALDPLEMTLEIARQEPAEGAHLDATLAWSGGVSAPVTEDLRQAAFAMTNIAPGTMGTSLRDAVAAALSSVPCARVFTSFDPETGSLEIHGHVPSADDAKALTGQVERALNGNLPVTNALLHLPRPQCGVLSGLERAGLSQSVEQFTDPKLIGEAAFAREYNYRNGNQIRLDLAGADYDGWLYIDYYDTSGRVLHLTPSDSVPLEKLAAKAIVTFGGGALNDLAAGRINLVVAPPFGQDVAVAMVSSVPLFDKPREQEESAADYLVDLAEQVAKYERTAADFKAEWVYLFVATSP